MSTLIDFGKKKHKQKTKKRKCSIYVANTMEEKRYRYIQWTTKYECIFVQLFFGYRVNCRPAPYGIMEK